MTQLSKAMLEVRRGVDGILANRSYPRGGREIKYADLDQIVNAIQAKLLENNLRIESHLKDTDGKRFLETSIYHCESNERQTFSWGPIEAKDASSNIELATMHTWGRRYNLLGAFNLTVQDDGEDDALTQEEVQTRPSTVQEILEGVQAEDIELLAALQAEMNDIKSLSSFEEGWSEMKPKIQKLPQVLRQMMIISKDAKKDELEAA